MPPKPAAEIHSFVNPFTAGDVAATLREHGWLRRDEEAITPWLTEAVALLGPRAENREALVRLLGLIFEYDAHAVLAARECQEVLARRGARDVVRALATEILNGGPVDSNRLKEIVAAIKANLPYSSREIFHAPCAHGASRGRRTRPSGPAAQPRGGDRGTRTSQVRSHSHS